jgi:hypothetical protein
LFSEQLPPEVEEHERSLKKKKWLTTNVTIHLNILMLAF